VSRQHIANFYAHGNSPAFSVESEMTAMLTENERDMKIAESTGLLNIKRAEYSRKLQGFRQTRLRAHMGAWAPGMDDHMSKLKDFGKYGAVADALHWLLLQEVCAACVALSTYMNNKRTYENCNSKYTCLLHGNRVVPQLETHFI
jgi:hypothetical protein